MRAAAGFPVVGDLGGLLGGRLGGRLGGLLRGHLGDGGRQLREVDVRDVDVQAHGRASAPEAVDVARQIEPGGERGRQRARVQPATRAASGDGRRQRQ